MYPVHDIPQKLCNIRGITISSNPDYHPIMQADPSCSVTICNVESHFMPRSVKDVEIIVTDRTKLCGQSNYGAMDHCTHCCIHAIHAYSPIIGLPRSNMTHIMYLLLNVRPAITYELKYGNEIWQCDQIVIVRIQRVLWYKSCKQPLSTLC